MLPPSESPQPQEKAINDRLLPENAPPQTQKIDAKVEAVHSLGVIPERDPEL